MMVKDEGHQKGRIVYFSHGGGPLPILGDKSHQAMVDFMKNLPSQLAKPDTILVVSAHWEENEATVLGSPHPGMFYDYYGFPDETYTITYPAPGNPDLASRITGLLEKNHIPARIDDRRGFDHGLFIPLKLMYPMADIPSLQLSLVRGLDPAAHINLGKALNRLMQDNILVIGSGFSFHNMAAFSWRGRNEPDRANETFQDWLINVCTGALSKTEHEKQLIEWEKAPHARYCHPREEHLMPLHVCTGLADNPAKVIFDDSILGKRAVAFLW